MSAAIRRATRRFLFLLTIMLTDLMASLPPGASPGLASTHGFADIMQQAYLKASNTGPEDNFGTGLAISGDTIAVGAPLESSSATGINGDQSNNGTLFSGQFGSSVNVSTDLVVVGAYREDSNARGIGGNQSNNSATDSGAAYVFARSGNTWVQQAYLKGSNSETGDQFGQASILGDTLAIAGNREDSDATGIDGDENNDNAEDSGAIYIFARDGSTWSQTAYLKASNTGAGDNFAKSAAADGTLVVAALEEDSSATGIDADQTNDAATDSGAAYVFTGFGAVSTTTTTLQDANFCGQPISGGGSPKAGDCLYILKAAVGAVTCAMPCICDVNSAGGISTTDALLCLKHVVGQPVALNCSCP